MKKVCHAEASEPSHWIPVSEPGQSLEQPVVVQNGYVGRSDSGGGTASRRKRRVSASDRRRCRRSERESSTESKRTFFPSGLYETIMASRSTTRDSVSSLSPVVGFGLVVAITLAAVIAVGLLAVVLVG
jgi:hypothetical protein